MDYSYDDDFLIDGVENIEEIEATAKEEISKLTTSEDPFILEQLTTNRVYMLIAKKNLEGDGYKDKYDIYKKEFNYYLSLSSQSKPLSGVGSVSIGRS